MEQYQLANPIEKAKEHRNIVCDLVWQLERTMLTPLVEEVIEELQAERDLVCFNAFDDFFEDEFLNNDTIPDDMAQTQEEQDQEDERRHRVYVMERRNKNTVRKTEAVS